MRSKPGVTTPAPALGHEKEETPPSFEPQPGVTTPAPALGQEKEEMSPNSEPRPGEATPAPALGKEKEETPPISEPWPEPASPFQRSLGFSFMHSGAFKMSPPNELKSLPWWEWQQ